MRLPCVYFPPPAGERGVSTCHKKSSASLVRVIFVTFLGDICHKIGKSYMIFI